MHNILKQTTSQTQISLNWTSGERANEVVGEYIHCIGMFITYFAQQVSVSLEILRLIIGKDIHLLFSTAGQC